MKFEEIIIENELCYKLSNDDLSVIISSFGAGIYSLKYKGKEMVMVPKDFSIYLYCDSYYGKTVGRIAGRLKDGILKFQDKTFCLPANEVSTTLHGGKEGFSFKKFSGSFKNDELILSYTSLLMCI